MILLLIRYTSGTKFCNTEDENEILDYAEQGQMTQTLFILFTFSKLVLVSKHTMSSFFIISKCKKIHPLAARLPSDVLNY